MTFGLVCFVTFFFLPEFKNVGTADTVYKVYDQIKRAGPDLLIPPPPRLEDTREAPKMIIRHEEEFQEDPHLLDDREKLRAKIEQDGELKVLERPDVGVAPKSSSTIREHVLIVNNQMEENNAAEVVERIVTVPAAISEHYPLIQGGEAADSVARERREVVKQVSIFDLGLFL